MKEIIKKLMPNATVTDTLFSVNLTPDDVETFCPYSTYFYDICILWLNLRDINFRSIYIPLNSCMVKCRNDDVKFYVTAAFGPMEYLCIDNYEGLLKL